MPNEHWRRRIKPSVIEGAWVLSQEQTLRPDVPVADVVRLLRSTYVSAGFDFTSGQELLQLVQVSSDRAKFYRDAFERALLRDRPPILVLLLQGRDAFCDALDEDTLECFRRAGAMADCPSEEVVRWLDQLAALARAEVDNSKSMAGRNAERKTMEWEISRLRGLHIEAPPVWTSLNDNSAGYDIRSWDTLATSSERLLTRYIEVKSYAGSSPRFFVTGNEVRVGEQHSSAYFLYVWSSKGTEPLVIPWLELQPYLPCDSDRAQSSEILVHWPKALDPSRQVEPRRR
jgi:hypothetical protein